MGNKKGTIRVEGLVGKTRDLYGNIGYYAGYHDNSDLTRVTDDLQEAMFYEPSDSPGYLDYLDELIPVVKISKRGKHDKITVTIILKD